MSGHGAPWWRRLMVAAVAVLAVGIVAAALLAFYRLSAEQAGARGEPLAQQPVDLRFRTIDGDSGAAMPGVRVAVTIETWEGERQTAARSDDDGLLVLDGVPREATVTVTPRTPSGYAGFPVEVDVATAGGGSAEVAAVVDAIVAMAEVAVADDETAAGGGELQLGAPQEPVAVPLYREKQQWTSWGRNDGRLRVGPDAGRPKGDPLWAHDAKYNLEFPPSLAYGMVFYGTYRGFVYAHRQSDGELVWKHHPGNQRRDSKFANQVAVSSWMEGSGADRRRVARVYYANLDGVVGALDAFSGEPVWRRVSGRGPGTEGRTLVFQSFESSPLVVGETVYVASRYHNVDSEAGLWALDRRTGAVRWFRKLGSTAQSKITSSPSYARGKVFIASYDGTVFAVDAKSGEMVWQSWLGGEFYSTPTVAGDRLYIGNKANGMLYCLSTSDGRLLWNSPLGTSVYGSPALWGGMLYVGTVNQFMAVSAGTGAVVWRVPTAERVLGSATVLDGVVYFSDLGSTYAHDARTGEQVWKWKAGRYSPVTATRHLIMVTGRTRIWAFEPSS